MNQLFDVFKTRFIIFFFYDILVYNRTREEHVHHLEQVLGLLQQHEFFIQLSKCSFGLSDLVYLSHIISAQGVQPDLEKVEVVKSWLEPKTVTNVRSFLVFTSYYRCFI